ncbi:MAG: tetratricopeptide repeat protein [Myxococcales bacterium]|nr:tetratricopeptide repeat protein [Myxococcales bacterium]
MIRSRFAPALLAALLLTPACDRGAKELTPEEAAAKLQSDLESAETLVVNNKLDEAEKIFMRVLETDEPGNARALAGMGKVRFEQQKYDEAQRYLADAVAKQGDDAPLQYALGRAYQASDDHAKAADAYGKAWALDANTSDYGLSYGRMLKQTGKFAEAEKVLRDVGELDAKAQFVWSELGDALREQGKLDDSLRTYMKAQNTYPSDKQAFAGAALVYEAQGDNRHALDEWSTYIRMDCCSDYSKSVAQKKIETLKVDHGEGAEPEG